MAIFCSIKLILGAVSLIHLSACNVVICYMSHVNPVIMSCIHFTVPITGTVVFHWAMTGQSIFHSEINNNNSGKNNSNTTDFIDEPFCLIQVIFLYLSRNVKPIKRRSSFCRTAFSSDCSSFKHFT